MRSLSVTVPDEMVEEIRDRREKDVNRSQYVREALAARFEAEDEDEWEAPESYEIEVDVL